jgi:hypothetical protein
MSLEVKLNSHTAVIILILCLIFTLYIFKSYDSNNSTANQLLKTNITDEIVTTTEADYLNEFIDFSDDEWKYSMLDNSENHVLDFKEEYKHQNTYVFSPDGKYISFPESDGDKHYIVIFDLVNNIVSDKYEVGVNSNARIPLWITQWTNNDEILYTFIHSSYKYKVDSKEVTALGKYIFYPYEITAENLLV